MFLFYALDTHGIFYTEFASNCWSFWPYEKDLFSKFVIRKICKFTYEKLTFFLGKPYQFFLFHNLGTKSILHAQVVLIWTTPWHDKKDLFLNSLFAKFANFRTWDTLYRVWTISRSFWPYEKDRPIFKIIYLK